MKILTIFFLVIFLATPVWAQNDEPIVKNGDFESGTLGWEVSNVNGVKLNDNDQECISGKTLRFLKGHASYIQQSIELEPNTNYVLKFTSRAQDEVGKNGSQNLTDPLNCVFFVTIYDFNTNKHVIQKFIQSNVNVDYSYEFTSPANTSNIVIKFNKTVNNGKYYVAYLDNISVKKINADKEEPEIPAEIIKRPSLMLSNLTKELIMSEILPDTKVTITSPKGEITEFPEGSPEIKFSFEGKPTGNYTIELEGSQAKTFIINTSSLKK